MIFSKFGVKAALTIAACIIATNSRGDQASHWFEEDRLKVSIGAFVTDSESTFRINPDEPGSGTKVRMEDDLGLDSSTEVTRLDGVYRFGPRHRLTFSYYDLSRDANEIISTTIIIDDTVFPVNSALKTRFDYQVLKLSYIYSVWQTEKVDLGLSGGLYTFDLDLKVESDLGASESEDGTAPFPVFGLHLDYRFEKDVYLIGSYEYFKIDENDFEGDLTDFRLGVELRHFENIGFGLTYNDVSLNTESTDNDDTFDYEYDGILAYLSWYL